MKHAWEDQKLIHLSENLKTGNAWETAMGKADHNKTELRCKGLSGILLFQVGFQGVFFWSRRCASDSIQRSGQFRDLLSEEGLVWGDCVGDTSATSYSWLQGWRTYGMWKDFLGIWHVLLSNSFLFLYFARQASPYCEEHVYVYTYLTAHRLCMNYRC